MASKEVAQDLVAFAPNGLRIINTLECGTGTHEVGSFWRDGDGAFVVEFGDDYHDHDQETVKIDGQTIFMDEKDGMWSEPALTYKTRAGKVVRKGADLPELHIPDLTVGLELAVRVERITGRCQQPLGEVDWINAVNRRDWNEERQVKHLEDFVRQLGLMPALAAYAMKIEADHAEHA